MAKGRRVAIPMGGVPPWLTKGKRYEIQQEGARGFDVICDSGGSIYCLKERCAHLHSMHTTNGKPGRWKILTERK